MMHALIVLGSQRCNFGLDILGSHPLWALHQPEKQLDFLRKIRCNFIIRSLKNKLLSNFRFKITRVDLLRLESLHYTIKVLIALK
jgi:hypothetical protein